MTTTATTLTKFSTGFYQKLLAASVSLLSCLLPIFLFTPLTLFIGNQDEFSQGIISILAFLLLPISLVFGSALILLMILPNNLAQRLIGFLSALGILLYIQGNWLLWNYGQLDGSAILWDKYKLSGLVDCLVWFLVLTAALFYSRRIAQRAVVIGFLLISIQLINLGLLSITNQVRWFSTELPEERRNIAQFSSEKNVLVIVLDGFAAPAFSQILAKDPKLGNELDGFTYFRNTLGSFPTTSPSIPAILSGKAYENDIPIKEFLEKVLLNDSIPSVLKKTGFNVQLATIPHYCQTLQSTSCGPPPFYTAANLSRVQKKELGILLDTTLFRHSPQPIKRVVQNQDNWLFQNLLNTRRGPRTQTDSLDLVDLITSQANLNAHSPTFKFIHLMLPHYPLRLDANCNFSAQRLAATPENYIEQARCALALTLRLTKKLSELEVYKQSLIVITADHGVRLPFDLGQSRDKTGTASLALPLLLIKPQAATGPLQISEVPAQLTDIPRTIARLLKIDSQLPGESLFELVANASRNRYFRLYTWDNQYWLKSHLPPMQEYLVSGDAWDAAAWKASRRLEPEL